MTEDCDDYGYWDGDDEPDPADEIEQAVQDCGQNADATWCDLAGTEHCDFRCIFRHSIKWGGGNE